MIRLIVIAILLLANVPSHAQEAVQVGGQKAFLHVPASPRASAVLIPGKGGIIPDDPLLRNRAALNAPDACDLTPPAAVEPFVKCSGGKATVAWIGGSGTGKDPRGPNSAHGFTGADGEVVGAIVEFVAR
jgi:hypothetical protein